MANFNIKFVIFGNKDYSNDGAVHNNLIQYGTNKKNFIVDKSIFHGDDPMPNTKKVLTVVYESSGTLRILYGVEGAHVQFLV